MPIDPHSYRALPIADGTWKLGRIVGGHPDKGFCLVSRWVWTKQAWAGSTKYPAIFCYAHVTEDEAKMWMRNRMPPARLGRAPSPSQILAWKGQSQLLTS